MSSPPAQPARTEFSDRPAPALAIISPRTTGNDRQAVASEASSDLKRATQAEEPTSKLWLTISVPTSRVVTEVAGNHNCTEMICGADRLPQLGPREYEFARAAGLLAFVPVAESLVERHFPNALSLRWERDQDLESSDEWLWLWVTTRVLDHEEFDRIEHLRREWWTLVPWPMKDKVVITAIDQGDASGPEEVS